MSQYRKSHNAAGTLLGDRYTLLTLIAQGGMGEVWKARDRDTGHLVAAKVLRPELFGEELSLTRLRTEARNAMIIDHPNIASVLDSGEEEGCGWIVMELVEGRPLSDFLGSGKTLSVGELIPLLFQIAQALSAAAQAGVVHRDIKPANIIIRPDGIVKLTDFGISQTSNQPTMTQAGMVMGTAQYLPPEQALGEPATPLGDLYGVGVIAYECLAGHRPFTGQSLVDIAFAHVNEPVPPLPENIPPVVVSVIMSLLEKEPRKRLQSGVDLAREVRQIAQTLSLSVEPRPLAEAYAVSLIADEGAASMSDSENSSGTPHISAALAQSDQPPSIPPPAMRRDEALRPVLRSAEVDPDPDPKAGESLPPMYPPSPDVEPAHHEVSASRLDLEGDRPGSRKDVRAQRERAKSRIVPMVDAEASSVGQAADPFLYDLDVDAGVKGAPVPESLTGHVREPWESAPHEGTAPESMTRQGAPSKALRARRALHTDKVEERRSGPSAKPVQAEVSTARRPRPQWRNIGQAQASSGAENARRSAEKDQPFKKYNRSLVAPPLTRREQIGRTIVISLIIVTVVLIVAATIVNKFGSLSSLLVSVPRFSEELQTWSVPWTTV